MIVRHKGIWHERYEDAPFIGALISSINCKFNCRNCFNQHIKNYNMLENTENEIISIIKANEFNQGIILAGLEWTLQYEELLALINRAIKSDLKVILYTGFNEIEFSTLYPYIYKLPIYIKFGKYDELKNSNNYYSYGVKLSSSNQYISDLSIKGDVNINENQN